MILLKLDVDLFDFGFKKRLIFLFLERHTSLLVVRYKRKIQNSPKEKLEIENKNELKGG